MAASVEEISLQKQRQRQRQQNRMLTSHQARGKWMIPAYKCLMYTSFSASMYMMCRMLLVGAFQTHKQIKLLTSSRATRPGSARTR
jgi:hypothetical protein